LSYRTYSASWYCAYDVRICSSDSSLKLIYYGIVRQQSGEDWDDVEITLAAAEPSLSGTPGELRSKIVEWAPDPAERRKFMRPQSGSMLFGAVSSCAPIPPAAPAPVPAQYATAGVALEGGRNAAFGISGTRTVSSDNRHLKMTVAVLDLVSQFMYYCVPSLSPNVFLAAKTRNSSDYPILSSNHVSIFLDTTFVSKTSLAAVSPGEYFHSFLGVEPSVKIDSRPLRKYDTHRGMFKLLGKSIDTIYEYFVSVTNTKSTPISITIVQQLPRSTNEKVKVKLVEPTQASLKDVSATNDSKAMLADMPESAEGHVAINQTTNNIIWTKNVAGGEKIDVPFSYTIQRPEGEEIQFS